MAVFNADDARTIRSLGLTMGGFFALTVVLIIAAIAIS